MLDFFRKLFRRLTGAAPKPAPSARPAAAPAAEPSPLDDPEPETRPTGDPAPAGDLLLLTLRRTQAGPADTLGQLLLEGQPLAVTLENAPGSPEGLIPPGRYALALRTEGGQHATYAYRFGDWHRGMLWVQGVPGLPFPYLRMGETATETYGSIAVGRELAPGSENPRRLWFPEAGYRALYARVADHLAAGKPAALEVLAP